MLAVACLPAWSILVEIVADIAILHRYFRGEYLQTAGILRKALWRSSATAR